MACILTPRYIVQSRPRGFSRRAGRSRARGARDIPWNSLVNAYENAWTVDQARYCGGPWIQSC